MPITFDTRSIDRFAHTPKYRQLADLLRAAIDDGRLQPGEEIQSEDSIASLVGLSRDSVRKALDVLAGEGLIVRRSGSGTRVASPPPQRRMHASRYAEELALLEKGGEHPKRSAFTVDHGIDWEDYRVDMVLTTEEATEKDAELLQIEVGQPVLRRSFIKYAAGEPVQLQRSAIPWDIAKDSPVADPGSPPAPGGTIAELWDLGWRIKKVTEDASARNPTDDERRRLEMETPGPVFDIVRVFWARPRSGKPTKELRAVEVSRVIAPSSRNLLHYETELPD